MKVFVSWSGDYSKAVATLLRKYLPIILHDVQPFVSAHDIESGTRWASRLTTELESTSFGILCLTPSNLTSPWVLFEAGALSKLNESALTGLLIGGLTATEVTGPLSQFQNRQFERDQIRKLIQDISSRCPRPLEAEQFDLLFDAFWPKIETEFKSISEALGDKPSLASKRTDRDMIEEIVMRLRRLERLENVALPTSAVGERLLDLPVNESTLRAYTEWRYPGQGVSDHWQLALLRDIKLEKYPTLRQLDEAVRRASPAVLAYQQEQPSLFPTGTDYITKSLGFVDPDFRSAHGFADVTLIAFHKYAKLIKA